MLGQLSRKLARVRKVVSFSRCRTERCAISRVGATFPKVRHGLKFRAFSVSRAWKRRTFQSWSNFSKSRPRLEKPPLFPEDEKKRRTFPSWRNFPESWRWIRIFFFSSAQRTANAKTMPKTSQKRHFFPRVGASSAQAPRTGTFARKRTPFRAALSKARKLATERTFTKRRLPPGENALFPEASGKDAESWQRFGEIEIFVFQGMKRTLRERILQKFETLHIESNFSAVTAAPITQAQSPKNTSQQNQQETNTEAPEMWISGTMPESWASN